VTALQVEAETEIARFAVAVYGSTQPDKIAALMRGADDGLLSRFLWLWPEPIPFRLGRTLPGANWAIAALDKLRELDLQPGAQPGAPARPTEISRSVHDPQCAPVDDGEQIAVPGAGEL
jgi:hypothetical protein